MLSLDIIYQMEMFPLSKAFPCRGERDLRCKMLNYFFKMMLRVSIGAYGIWVLLAPGKKCHYCVNMGSSSETLLTWLFFETEKQYQLSPWYPGSSSCSTKRQFSSQQGSNFDPSILWCLVFVRRRPSTKCTLDLHSRVVLLVRFLKLCAILYISFFFFFKRNLLNIGIFIYLQKSWVTKQQFSVRHSESLCAEKHFSGVAVFVSCWTLGFPCVVISFKSVFYSIFLPRVTSEFFTISFSF